MKHYIDIVNRRNAIKPVHFYSSSDFDIFRRFYESINNYDYRSSLHYSQEIQNRFLSQGKAVY